MLWQISKVQPTGTGQVTAQSVVEAVGSQPISPALAIRRILYELRGADAGDGEAALEQAERQLTALLCHDQSD